MSSLKWTNVLLLILLALSFLFTAFPTSTPQAANAQTDQKNVLLIGWDGVQRNHLYELLNRSLMPNLKSFINQGVMVNVTVSDHGTDTKAGWTQILTGYRWWRTGAYNNNYWFHSIPAGYTSLERAESYFGKNQIVTAFRVGKLFHMEITDGTGDAANGKYTNQALYRNLPATLDVVDNGDRNATTMGSLLQTFLQNRQNNHFFAFFHFSDPDTNGHQYGENSDQYEAAIEACDYQLGLVLDKLNQLNLTQKTLIYLTADHGFDEGGIGQFGHSNAPYIFLASNDKNIVRGGDQIDVAPTVYYGLGMWGQEFNPPLDGYPMQLSLPQGIEETRQTALDDLVQPPKATISSPATTVSVTGTVNVVFNASDSTLSAVLLLVNNVLTSDGPWSWQQGNDVTANGSYAWNTATLGDGTYTLSIISFDAHGSNNPPSTATVSVSKITPQSEATTQPVTSPPTQTLKPSPQTSPTPPPQTSTPAESISPTISPRNSQDIPYGNGVLFGIVVAAVAIAVLGSIVGYRRLHGRR